MGRITAVALIVAALVVGAAVMRYVDTSTFQRLAGEVTQLRQDQSKSDAQLKDRDEQIKGLKAQLEEREQKIMKDCPEK